MSDINPLKQEKLGFEIILCNRNQLSSNSRSPGEKLGVEIILSNRKISF